MDIFCKVIVIDNMNFRIRNYYAIIMHERILVRVIKAPLKIKFKNDWKVTEKLLKNSSENL